MPRKHRKSFHAAISAILMLATTASASAQSGQAQIGDLVEFTSGLGPMLAEIVVAPDPAGYVVILIPGGKQVPVKVSKLRLVQAAGTANDPMPVGTAVRWTVSGVTEQGSVTKVNGQWCQVRTEPATTVGWLECKKLRTGAPSAKDNVAKPAPGSKGTTVKLPGKWENADASAKLEFQAGGKCYLSFGPMTSKCTYQQNDGNVTILFEGEEMVLTADEDGSLSGDPDAMIPMRFTKK